jgi:putative flippase GtrA
VNPNYLIIDLLRQHTGTVSILNMESLQIRFIAIGGWNTFFGLATYTIILSFANDKFYIQALILSTLLSGIQAYFAQRVLVWKSSNAIPREFSRFVIVLTAQFFINLVLIIIFVGLMGFDPVRTQYGIVLAIVFSTYFTHKHWTFKNDS